ncbi:MAG: hypothetical protein RLY71_3039, partial [Pseudomonadota bacterium]
NTNNAHGRNVVYRWLNEVHEAQVVHYGRRLMLEFVLNRPAAHFIATSAALWGEDWLRPVPLDQLGVASFRDITPDNYAGLAARYGVTEVSPAPTATLYVSAVLRDDQQKLLPIPDGYQVEDAFVRSANASQPAVMPTVLIGRHVIDPRAPSIGVPRHFGEEMAIPVAVVAAQPVALSPPVEAVQCLVNVEVRCCPTARHLDRWRIDTHAALLQAYRAALTRHEERLRGTVAGHRSLQSAAARRDTERREIQRGCLQLLIERAERQVGDGSPPGSFWELEPRYLQFLDTALEWREMSYSFYASIRGTAPAVVGVQNVGDDAMFASFLQAGSARVLLPVTPDQVLAFLFFLSSGQLWEEIDTTAPICPGDALPVLELKKNPATRPDACRIGECWEFEVPTSMQMVTAESEFGLGEMK